MQSTATETVTYLNQELAQNTDVELMEELGWSLEALMELAGLSVAQAIHDCNVKYHGSSLKKALVLIGSGNNGGDGYVAASHLKLFGWETHLLQFKKPEKDFFKKMTKRCEANNIPVHNYQEDKLGDDFVNYVNNNYDLVVDAIFGFSFKGPMRDPFGKVMEDLKTISKPIFSIDIPSGWDVEKGNVNNTFEPAYVISLTLPKLGVKEFKGRHYLGGRFVPEQMQKKYGWKIPQYEGTKQFVEL